MDDNSSKDNVVYLGGNETKALFPTLRDMSISEWARELCTTHLLYQKTPAPAIERILSDYSDEEMVTIGEGAFAYLERIMELVKDHRSET